MNDLSINNICRLIGQPTYNYLSSLGPAAIPIALTTIGAIGLGCKICWSWKAIPEPKTYNLDIEKEYNRFGIQVLKLLETQAPGTIEETVQTFKNFTGSIKRCGVGLNDSLPIWGKLAENYLEIAKEALTTPQQREELQVFINELREKNGKTSYEWFFLFCDRLTILMSDPKFRGIPTENRGTDFDAYRMELENYKINGQYCWLSHDSYVRACAQVGEPHTTLRYSSTALCRRLFPRVIMMPFPFDLDCAAIVLSLPEPGEEDENLWLVGYIKKREIADDVLYTPSRYFIHDLFHLNRFLSFLFFEDLFYIEETEALVKAVPKKWEQLTLQALKKMKEVVRTHSGDEKLIYSFFAFFIFHEHSESLAYSLNRLVESDQSHANSLTAHLRQFEKSYLLKRFIDLLPKNLLVYGYGKWCGLRSKPTLNWNFMSQYASSFVALLSKDSEFREEITAKFKEFNSLLSHAVINCILQSEFDFYSASEGIHISRFLNLPKAEQMTNGIITAPINHYVTFRIPNIYQNIN